RAVVASREGAKVGHHTVLPYERVTHPAGPTQADDLTAVIDVRRQRKRSAGRVEIADHAALPHDRVRIAVGSVAPANDLTAIVDGGRLSVGAAECVQLRHRAVLPE